MQLQTISISIVLFICLHHHMQAIPVEQIKIFPSKYDNNTGELKSPFYSRRCINQSNCRDHSLCDNGTCVCQKGWITWGNSEECGYEQKSILIAFLLSLFAGSFGLDWFYLACNDAVYIVVGIIKLMLSGGCGGTRTSSSPIKNEKAKTGLTSLVGLWWLIDWIRILAHVFPDGNGAPLST
jgi:hypothetical protein